MRSESDERGAYHLLWEVSVTFCADLGDSLGHDRAAHPSTLRTAKYIRYTSNHGTDVWICLQWMCEGFSAQGHGIEADCGACLYPKQAIGEARAKELDARLADFCVVAVAVLERQYHFLFNARASFWVAHLGRYSLPFRYSF